MKKLAISIGVFLCLMILGPVEAAKKPKPCNNCYCSVVATDVNFGPYDGLAQLEVDSAGDIEVSCGTDTLGDTISYSVELSDGKKGSAPREMKGPGKYVLTYNLYTDVSRTIIWGDGKGTTAAIADGYSFTVLCCEVRNYTMYGRIDSGQNVEPGLYINSITVNIEF